MPRKKVVVRSHSRGRSRGPGRVHVKRYVRTQNPETEQHDLEQVLGPEHDIFGRNVPEGEKCSHCGWQKPVYQRDVSGQPICRECHDVHYESQITRRLEHEKRDHMTDQRLREWDRWQQGAPTIRRSGI